jgi:hypothetical protein
LRVLGFEVSVYNVYMMTASLLKLLHWLANTGRILPASILSWYFFSPSL